MTLEALRGLSHLEWRITHRKKLGQGISVLRYAVTGDRASRMVDRMVASPDPVKLKQLSVTAEILTVEADLHAEGHLTIEVMFDASINDDFSDL